MKVTKGCTKAVIAVAVSAFALTSCNKSGWSDAEIKLINDSSVTMRVLTVCNVKDSLLLRDKCRAIGIQELKSKEYDTLAEKMIATVTSPEQDGVGIAGPQVGILRRIVAVQRFPQ